VATCELGVLIYHSEMSALAHRRFQFHTDTCAQKYSKVSVWV
jgi:hypothetical protein